MSARGTTNGHRRCSCAATHKPLVLQDGALSHIAGTIVLSLKAPLTYTFNMTHLLIGYARCSTDKQDLAAQEAALLALGVAPDRIYMDHGMTGTSRARPGLDQALAAARAGDTLVVSKLDRLARSVPDARAIADDLIRREVRLALGHSVYDPHDPMGKMFFNILATFAEFEADLIRMRTREGMAIARANGKLKGKKPKLTTRQQKELRLMHDRGEHSISDLAEMFSVSRPTVYRTLARVASPAAPAMPPSAQSVATAIDDSEDQLQASSLARSPHNAADR